jgi:predicted small metal-binding protein
MVSVKTFACGEVVPDCPTVFSGPDYEAVLQVVADHARVVHQLPELPPEVTRALRQAWQRPDDRSDDRAPGRH